MTRGRVGVGVPDALRRGLAFIDSGNAGRGYPFNAFSNEEGRDVLREIIWSLERWRGLSVRYVAGPGAAEWTLRNQAPAPRVAPELGDGIFRRVGAA